MSEKTSYAPGEPIWTDLSSPDLAVSKAFYGPLLGWTAEAPEDRFGGYASWLKDGRKIAGLMPVMSPDQPPSWTTYVCSEDADKTVALVESSGGTIIAPPMAVDDLGRLAVLTDPSGAVFGIWEPGTHHGAELFAEPGAPCWFELTSQDPAAAASFYSSVFAWSVKTSEEYVELQLDGQSVAGVTDPTQGTPPGWLPYFGVDDPAAKAREAEQLGGTVVLPLAEWPGGACSIVRDPHGAVLGLITQEPSA